MAASVVHPKIDYCNSL